MSWNILLAGEGGQGVQIISDIICEAALQHGWHVSQIPNYGLEQRGGVSLSFVKLSETKILYPKFVTPHVVVVLSLQAKERIKIYQEGETIFSFEEYGAFLKENAISASSQNIFYLGLLSHWFSDKKILSYDEIFSLLEMKLLHKSNWEENKKAFLFGFNQ